MKVAAIDEALIVRVERVCHSVQRRFGKTNYWILSKIDLLIASVVGVQLGLHALGHASIYSNWGDGILLAGLAIPYLVHYGLFLWLYEETKAFTRLAQGHSNPEKIDQVHQIVRLFCFAGSVAATLGRIAFCGSGAIGIAQLLPIPETMFLLHFFLSACDPLPPCRGTFWEELETSGMCDNS